MKNLEPYKTFNTLDDTPDLEKIVDLLQDTFDKHGIVKSNHSIPRENISTYSIEKNSMGVKALVINLPHIYDTYRYTLLINQEIGSQKRDIERFINRSIVIRMFDYDDVVKIRIFIFK